MARCLSRFVGEERGTQLVELAIVLPVLLLMFAATAEFGRFFYTYSTLAKATRLGARYLSAKAVNVKEETTARNLVVYGDPAGGGTPLLTGLSTNNVEVTHAGGVGALPQTVTVRITSYRYQPLLNLGKLVGNPSLTLSIDVKPSTTMRYLLTQPPI